MTKEEAIKYLIRPIQTSTELSGECAKQFDAYLMAIDALKTEAIPVEWLEESTREREGTDYENFIIEVLNAWAEQRKEE